MNRTHSHSSVKPQRLAPDKAGSSALCPSLIFGSLRFGSRSPGTDFWSRATSATRLCGHGWLGLLALLLGLLLNGCVTPTAIDWETRVGKQTFDATVQELGQPGKMTSLADGSRVAEWLAIRGTSTPNYHSFPDGRVLRTESARGPDRWLVLTFSPDGQLKAWQRVWR